MKTIEEKKQIEEMKTVLNNYFDNTPMELSFKHKNGDTDIITDEKALGVLDAITRQALIPVFCEVLHNEGYRKQSEIIDEFAKRLLDAFPEGNRDAHCPAIYYDDYRYIIEEFAEKMKGGE